MELLHKSDINKPLINKIFIFNKISIKNKNLFFIFKIKDYKLNNLIFFY